MGARVERRTLSTGAGLANKSWKADLAGFWAMEWSAIAAAFK